MAMIGADIGLYLDSNGKLVVTNKDPEEGWKPLGPSHDFWLIARFGDVVKAHVTMIVDTVDVTMPMDQLRRFPKRRPPPPANPDAVAMRTPHVGMNVHKRRSLDCFTCRHNPTKPSEDFWKAPCCNCKPTGPWLNWEPALPAGLAEAAIAGAAAETMIQELREALVKMDARRMRAEEAAKISYRAAFLAAAQSVAGDWNDSRTNVNQREQAQRSADGLRRMAANL